MVVTKRLKFMTVIFNQWKFRNPYILVLTQKLGSKC